MRRWRSGDLVRWYGDPISKEVVWVRAETQRITLGAGEPARIVRWTDTEGNVWTEDCDE